MGDSRVISVAVGRDHVDPPSPYVALAGGVAVAAVVFTVMLLLRRTFGLKR